MPKVQVAKKSVFIDMTPMVDMAFLLVTFFMLATTFRPEEPVIVDMPKSIDDRPLPDTGVIQITFSKDGRIFIGTSQQGTRLKWINYIDQMYKMSLDDEEKKRFTLLSSFGMPIMKGDKNLKGYLEQPGGPERHAYFPDDQPGVSTDPIDGDSTHTELTDLITTAQAAGGQNVIAVRGDKEANYPAFRKVIMALQDLHDNAFSLITNLDGEKQAEFNKSASKPK